MQSIFRNGRDVEPRLVWPALTARLSSARRSCSDRIAPSWEVQFGQETRALRQLGGKEFRKTARKINRRAEQIGTEAEYDEEWGE